MIIENEYKLNINKKNVADVIDLIIEKNTYQTYMDYIYELPHLVANWIDVEVGKEHSIIVDGSKRYNDIK